MYLAIHLFSVVECALVVTASSVPLIVLLEIRWSLVLLAHVTCDEREAASPADRSSP